MTRRATDPVARRWGLCALVGLAAASAPACSRTPPTPTLAAVTGARDLGPGDAVLDLSWDGRDGAAVLFRRGDDVLLRVIGPANRGGSPERSLSGARDARVAPVAGGLVVATTGPEGAALLRLDGRGNAVQAPIPLPDVPAGAVPDVDGEPSGVVRVAWGVPEGAATTSARSLGAALAPATLVPGASPTWVRAADGFPALIGPEGVLRVDGQPAEPALHLGACGASVGGETRAVPTPCRDPVTAKAGPLFAVAARDDDAVHVNAGAPFTVRSEADGPPGPPRIAVWVHRGDVGGLVAWIQGEHVWAVALGGPHDP